MATAEPRYFRAFGETSVTLFASTRILVALLLVLAVLAAAVAAVEDPPLVPKPALALLTARVGQDERLQQLELELELAQILLG